MIRVNLLPQKRKSGGGPSAGASNQRWLLVVLGVLVVEVIGLFLFHQQKLEELADQKKKNDQLESQIADIRKLVANHEEIKKTLAVLRAREDAIAKLQSGRAGPTAVLLELAQVLTPGKQPTMDIERVNMMKRDNPSLPYFPGWDSRRVWLTQYAETDRVVRMEGLARDASDVAEFAQRLKFSVYFFDVVILPGKKEVDGGTKIELVSFALQLKVRY